VSLRWNELSDVWQISGNDGNFLDVATTSGVTTSINTHNSATTSVHGIANTANLVTLADAQTLTNKTLTSPTITGVSPVITLAGDLTGNVTLTDLGNGTLTATIAADSVALGTDTTGNYMSDVSAGTGITISHTAGEGSTATISIGQSVATNANPTFAGATLDAVQVGITAAGEIDTSSGNLTIDSAGGTVTVDDNLVVSGNLTVSGTTTTINTATLSVADNVVTLNSDFTTGDPTENAGIEVLRGGSSTVAIRWNETSDKWEATTDGTTYGNVVTTADSGTVSAGMIADVLFSAQTANYTLALSDKNKVVEMSNASATTLTIAADNSVNFPTGSQITILQTGAGQVTIAGASGVTVNATPGLKVRAQYSAVVALKRAANTWVVTGDLSA